jgi:hypothetical protein
MKGDFHVRICERLKLKCFGLLDHYKFGDINNNEQLIINLAAVPG